MTENEMLTILQNPANFPVVRRLDGLTLDYAMRLLLSLPASDFKELNPQGNFSFGDLPIPVQILSKVSENKPSQFSPAIKKEFRKLLKDITTEGKNKEYPYVFGAQRGQIFDKIHKMPVGESQSCQYDWKWIEEHLISEKLADDAIIFHTHPKPIGKPHDTLYSKHPEILAEMGVKPDGLNLSMADIIVNMKMDELIQKSGQDMTAQSYILMHDGSLVGFSTKGGVKLECYQKILDKSSETDLNV